MKAKCVYRLTRHGEVVHSTYDTITGKIEGLPEWFIEPKPFVEGDLSTLAYTQCTTDFARDCESILLSDDSLWLVFDYFTTHYRTVSWDGTMRIMRWMYDDNITKSYVHAPNKGLLREIGYRTTKPIQFRAFDTLYRLVERDGIIYSNGKEYIADFDTTLLDPPSFKYEGYTECVMGGYYGVVYLDGKPRFIKEADYMKDGKPVIMMV